MGRAIGAGPWAGPRSRLMGRAIEAGPWASPCRGIKGYKASWTGGPKGLSHGPAHVQAHWPAHGQIHGALFPHIWGARFTQETQPQLNRRVHILENIWGNF